MQERRLTQGTRVGQGLRPLVVLNTSWIDPFLIASTICGRPSDTLLIFCVGMPRSVKKRAVPPVACAWKPSVVSSRIVSTTRSLSASRTETNTLPPLGARAPAPSWLLAKAARKSDRDR